MYKIQKNTQIIGAGYFVCALIFLNISDILMKYLGNNTHPIQATSMRFIGCTVVLIPFLKEIFPKSNYKRVHCFRSILVVIASFLWFLGLHHIDLATSSIISFLSGIFVLPLAFLYLKEKFNRSRIASSIIGFLGILVAINPSNSGSSSYHYILVMVGASLLYAVIEVFTKKYCNQESNFITLYYTSLFGSIIAIIMAIPYFKMPQLFDVFLYIVMGVCNNLVLLLMLKAYRYADSSFLSSMHFVEFIQTSIFGYLIFQEVVSFFTIVGIGIIFFSIAYLIYTEYKYNRRL